MKRPFLLWFLIGFLLFLAVGGLYGGTTMLIDPTGKLIQMDGILPQLPVSTFFLPGLFLFVVMGILPLVLIFGLIGKVEWAWLIRMTAWSHYHWAWTGTVVLGISLLVWLAFQASLIGFQWPIQYITLTDGVLIVLTAIYPSIRKYYVKSN